MSGKPSIHPEPAPWKPWQPDVLDVPPAGKTADSLSEYTENIENAHDHLPPQLDAGHDAGAQENQLEACAAQPDDIREKAAALGHAQGYAEGFAEGMKDGTAKGHEEGYEQGLIIGQQEGYAKIHEQAERLTVLAEACAVSLDKLEASVGEALTSLAIRIARQLVQDTLTAHPEIVLELVHKVLDAYQGHHPLLTLRMHPDDVQLVQRELEGSMHTHSWRLLADSSLERGGCMASSAAGDIDATLSTQWECVLASLGRSSHAKKCPAA